MDNYEIEDRWKSEIREQMELAGIGMVDLARALGLTRARVYQIMATGQRLSPPVVERIRLAIARLMAQRAEALGMEIK